MLCKLGNAHVDVRSCLHAPHMTVCQLGDDTVVSGQINKVCSLFAGWFLQRYVLLACASATTFYLLLVLGRSTSFLFLKSAFRFEVATRMNA
jgi:hypothetical protein